MGPPGAPAGGFGRSLVGSPRLIRGRGGDLSGLGATLPERLTLARQRKMGHAAFLELLLGDEVARRDSRSAMLRAKAAGLDPTMRLDIWDEPDDLRYDRMLLSDLTSLRFTEPGRGALILGPVGVGKTRGPWTPTRSATLRAVVERHRKASTVVISNREPAEWLTMMSDALLAQSAVDRLTSGAHTLIIEGPSYRQRDRPDRRATVDPDREASDAP